MVHFEFGQDRLTQPHPLNAFELAQGAIKVRFGFFFGASDSVSDEVARYRKFTFRYTLDLERRKFAALPARIALGTSLREE